MAGAWLEALPAPRRAGYQISPTDRTIRTQMDRGNSRTRLRTSARVDEISCSVRLTNDQFVLFTAWFDDEVGGAAGGAGWFTVDLATGTSSGVFTSTQTARFIGPYEAGLVEDSEDSWDVSFKLEVRY